MYWEQCLRLFKKYFTFCLQSIPYTNLPTVCLLEGKNTPLKPFLSNSISCDDQKSTLNLCCLLLSHQEISYDCLEATDSCGLLGPTLCFKFSNSHNNRNYQKMCVMLQPVNTTSSILRFMTHCCKISQTAFNLRNKVTRGIESEKQTKYIPKSKHKKPWKTQRRVNTDFQFYHFDLIKFFG